MKINYLAGHVDDIEREVLDTLMYRGIEEVWYWYVIGDYEGSGWLVARKGNNWGTADLGHCSCYYYNEAINDLTLSYNSFEELKKRHSTEAFNQIGLSFGTNRYDELFD